MIISVLSGKGGVGKTTTTANIATILSHELGAKTIVLDANITTSSHLCLHFGMYGNIQLTLKDALEGKAGLNQTIYTHPLSGVRIIPAPLVLDKKVNIKKMAPLTKELKKNYDFVIVDCSAGLSEDTISAANSAEGAIIVTTPQIPDISDAMKTITIMQRSKKKVIGIVLNRVRGKGYEITPREVETICNVPVISVIPEDKKIQESLARGIPLYLYNKRSKASSQYFKLALMLTGQKTGYDFSSLGMSFFDRIKLFLGLGEEYDNQAQSNLLGKIKEDIKNKKIKLLK